MQSNIQAERRAKSRKQWIIVPVVVLGCCVIGAVGAIVAWPSLQVTWQGLLQAPALAPSATDVPTEQSQDAMPANPGPASGGPADGGRADQLLKSDVWKSIVDFYANSRNCTDVANTAIEVTQDPDASGVWKEAWTVAACGETTVLKVEFTPSPKGGTDYHITQ